MISFAVLGSGSGGNATFMRLGAHRVLIDAGLSPRAVAKRLSAIGVNPEDEPITDIVVTHFDHDHFAAGWCKPVLRDAIRVHLHERHRSRALRRGLDGRPLELFRDSFTIGDARIEPILLAHDELGSVGYVIEYGKTRVGWATDVGRVPRHMREKFVDLDAIAIESNYDPNMQLRSGRPAMLVRRIMSGRGHLSNAQSLDFVREVAKRSPNLKRIVKLHLSEQCNAPSKVHELYSLEAPRLAGRVLISAQRKPTEMIEVKGEGAARQMELFG